MLIMVLNDDSKLDDLLIEFNNIDIKGATVIDSHGMASVLSDYKEEHSIFGSLKLILNEKRPFNKTIFTIINDNKVPIAMNAIKKVIGDLNKPNVGIVFTLPVSFAEGIRDLN